MRQLQREWTAQDCEKLKALVHQGATPFRTSAALRRPLQMVKNKARELGCPFPPLRSLRAKTRAILENSGVREVRSRSRQ
jgi:hypothetical protein